MQTSQPQPAQMQPNPVVASAPPQQPMPAAAAPPPIVQHAQYAPPPPPPPQQQQQQPAQPQHLHQQQQPQQPMYSQQQQPAQAAPNQPQQPPNAQFQQQPAAAAAAAAALQPPAQPQNPPPQNAAPNQQHYPHQGLNGGWQSDKDYQERRKMIAKIVHLLQQRKPNAPQEWLKKLPQMAKRLEESLYRSAKSFAEYNDASTLKQRLQQLAVNIGMKTKKMQQAQIAQQKVPNPQVPGQPKPPQFPAQQPAQQVIRQASPHQPLAAQAVPQPVPQQQPQAVASQPQAAQAGGQRIVNVAEINPIMNGQPQQMLQQAPVAAPVQAPAQPAPAPVQFQPQAAPNQGQVPPPLPNAAPNQGQPNVARPPTGAQRQVSDRQQVLRHQQQRLLLLRHAAKCQHEDGQCPVTPHCAGMKRLWKHIAECKDQKCLVPHCVSSRYVLSHYHRCKDVRCPVCGPVREAIHRSHEKQKQMQALKQRHQQAVQQNQSAPIPPGSSAIAPNGMPVPGIAPVSGEQPNKRQRVGPPGHPSSVPSFVQPPGSQPMLQANALPHPGPTIKAGYVYSSPPVSGSGVPGRPQVAAVPGIAFSNGQVIMPKHTGPKPQEDHTLINCFTIEQIELHIASLNKGLQLAPQKLKTKCLEVLRVLQSHQHGWVFNSPVDPVELGLPDYFEVIKEPMDLGTIRKKLENGCYHTLEEFEASVHLTFDNAMLYNPEGSVVYNMAKEMKAKFVHDYEILIKQLNAEEDKKRRNGEACLLCGCEKLLFEPPVFYCNGFNCPSKRIRRNSYYYVGGNNQYHWCHQCFQDLRDGKSIELGDVTIRKEELMKKKNDELHEESWVQCDRCERWIHQICALFNTRQNKDQRSEYACPRCTIEERKQKDQKEAVSTTPMAEDLQRTKLSEHLENHVRKKMGEHLKNMAKQKAAVDKISLEEADKATQMGGEITIRQVTSMDKKLEVRERMKRRYAYKNYPDEFSFRCKCIVVFQNLDGVDVILFGLYVYEHDENNPPPNNRCVYISYLDSVHFMRPRQMRTFIYHEILISYLDYVRQRGFSTAHIWACPPLKGDDYILYAKPEDQKTPKDDRLRQWYIDMLVDSQKRGIVGKVTNMYDLYFSNESNDATVVPYMDGDYFPAEVENIIKDIEEGKTGKKSGSQGQKKKKSSGNNKAKQKKKTGRGGTRSTGLDEDALKASGIIPVGKDQQSLEEGGRDFVMVKLGETIQPMKESFIVAYLAWDGAEPENMVVPAAIQEHRKKYGVEVEWHPKKPEKKKAIETVHSQANKTQGDVKNEPGVNMEVDGTASASANSLGDASQTADSKGTDIAPIKNEKDVGDATDSKPTDENRDVSSSLAPAPPLAVGDGSTLAENADSNGSASLAPAGAHSSQNSVGSSSMTERKGKFAAMARKRGRDEPLGEETTASKSDKPESDDSASEKQPTVTTVKDSKGRMVKVIDDDVEEMDCEFLNNRQAFLNLCQGNHYQFDQLRRAKHSSMMVLWHLHNRDAPKFVQQCTTCSREILAGYRYHCPTCADFDQCQECVQNPNTPRHPHQLKAIPVATGQQSELTEAQRKDRQRSIQLHMTLLQHAATCVSPKCPSANCTKMKGLLKHGAQCQIKATGGCNVCKRIWALLQIHARQCKASSCPVPNCMAIRERVRQLKKQQQAMDDRRRQEMNRVYRGSR